MSALVFPFRGSAVFMKSLQIPGEFLSTWMAAFTDVPRLDFRQGNGVSSFKAGANACGSSRQLFCSERHTVEWSMVSRKSRFAVSATMVMWSCAAYARTQDPSWGLQEDRVASRRQVEELPRHPIPPNETHAQAPQEQ